MYRLRSFPVSQLYIFLKTMKLQWPKNFPKKNQKDKRCAKKNYLGCQFHIQAVKVEGLLDSVIDVTIQNNLKPFTNVIKRIEASQELKKKAKKLKLSDPEIQGSELLFNFKRV